MSLKDSFLVLRSLNVNKTPFSTYRERGFTTKSKIFDIPAFWEGATSIKLISGVVALLSCS